MSFAIPLAIAAFAAKSVYDTVQSTKASKKAANEAANQNAAAIQGVKDAQSTASTQAQKALDKRRTSASQTVFTSPLGVGGQASVARKTLLGE